MIRHVWSVICQSASFDGQTNSVSLFNILEYLVVPVEPTISRPLLFGCEIVSLWSRSDINIPVTGEMRLYYIGPDGKKAPDVSLEINLLPQFTHRTRITANPIAFFSAGLYNFHVEFREKESLTWETAAILPILVIVE